MKITVLCENSISMWLQCTHNIWAEHWLSLFIEIDKVKILFDTANTWLYIKNAKKLWIDLQKTDFVVLSHNHDDHSWWLYFHNFKTKKKIIFHPQVLKELPANQSKRIETDFDIITSSRPIEFTKNVFYLWKIPHTTTFESGKDKNNKIIVDDSAIAIKTPKWVFVVTGCSHSWICNICEYAKKITWQNLLWVIWWFHLFYKYHKKTIEWTIKYFKKEKTKHLFPMHCIDFEAMAKIHQTIPFEKLWTGSVIEI
jgi:7,8-dihydropterin-6-yl-methyl-4-(beta-D-ribofuranosyl)aminobenzene 5'-phosphate synthase